MNVQRLSFAEAILLAPDLVELVIDDGVDVTAPMVDEWHEFLARHLVTPCLILVNRRNHYSYTFEAQMKVGSSPQICAVAVLAYDQQSRLIVSGMENLVPRDGRWNMAVFTERGKALDWLRSCAERHPSAAMSARQYAAQ